MSTNLLASILRIQTKIIFKTGILTVLGGIILSILPSLPVIAQGPESENNQTTTTERTSEENPAQPARGVDEQHAGPRERRVSVGYSGPRSVSYTHLTLPTIYSV